MKRLMKMLVLLSILFILGSCSTSKSVIGLTESVPDGKIAIKINISRASFPAGTIASVSPDDYNSDFDLKIKNITKNEESKSAAINQNIIVDAGDEFELTGTYDLLSGGYRTITVSRFTALIYDSQSRTLRVTIKSDGSTGTRVTTGTY